MRQRTRTGCHRQVWLCRQTGLLAAADIHDLDIDVARLRTAFDTDTDALYGHYMLKLVGQVRKAV